MEAECVNKYKFIMDTNGLEFKKYIISGEVLSATEKVLSDYGYKKPSTEGLVYWGGTRDNDITYIDMLIAPFCETGPERVSVSQYSNSIVVKHLCDNKRVQIAQVHSHPSNWVGHSLGDDKLAPFKVTGLLSIVVPSYGLKGMKPLINCGFHIYLDDFYRIPRKVVSKIFEISESGKHIIIDFRNDK